MALTYTPSDELGKPMPDFELPTVDGKTFNSDSIAQAKAKVIVFMCNHCPYVKAIENRLIKLAAELAQLEIPFVGICSNDPKDHPEDHPAQLFKRWQEKHYGFKYLVDESQAVARSFGAVCTPDFFVYDGKNRLVYRGRLDDSWRDETKVAREELKTAVEKILSTQNKKPELLMLEQTPSMGCSIKWKE